MWCGIAPCQVLANSARPISGSGIEDGGGEKQRGGGDKKEGQPLEACRWRTSRDAEV